ncbi:MAG TPA: septation inhibitor protein, partial [Microbacterium sp.]|nr:septation inhibitor protein [Microbacterium sp.]
MARPGREDDAMAERPEGEPAPNPVWFKPIMLGLMLLGLA